MCPFITHLQRALILGRTSRVDELDAKIFQVITELKRLPETLGMLIPLEVLRRLLRRLPHLVDVDSGRLYLEELRLWHRKFASTLNTFYRVSLRNSFLPTGGTTVCLLFGR